MYSGKEFYGPEGGVFEFEVVSRPYLDTEPTNNHPCTWLIQPVVG